MICSCIQLIISRRGLLNSNICLGGITKFTTDNHHKFTVKTRVDALNMLGFMKDDKPSRDQVNAAFRVKALETHPDASSDGGDDMFLNVVVAKEILLNGEVSSTSSSWSGVNAQPRPLTSMEDFAAYADWVRSKSNYKIEEIKKVGSRGNKMPTLNRNHLSVNSNARVPHKKRADAGGELTWHREHRRKIQQHKRYEILSRFAFIKSTTFNQRGINSRFR